MTKKLTPLMQQFFEIKEQYPDALLLFQVGDFYEMFFDDAVTAAQFLAIALTKRGKSNGNDIPLCGVPVHALQYYLIKLVQGGYKVAVCDQVTKPQPGTVVKRKVTRVYTPGTLTDSALLDDTRASYLSALYYDSANNEYTVAFTELLTAQLFITSVSAHDTKLLESQLMRFMPDEIVCSSELNEAMQKQLRQYGLYVSHTSIASPTDWVQQQFGAQASELLSHHGVTEVLGLLYAYLLRNNEASLSQYSAATVYEADAFMLLDGATRTNLELIRNSSGTSSNTLFSVINRCATSMGARMLKKWLAQPLLNEHAIMQRQVVIGHMVSMVAVRQKLTELLKTCTDVERIVGRIALQRAIFADYVQLRQTLSLIMPLRDVLGQLPETPLLQSLRSRLHDFSLLTDLLDRSLAVDEGSVIRPGFDIKLDELRDLAENGQQKIAQLVNSEIEATGIPMKVVYTSVGGYALEVTKTHVDKVPERFRLTNKLVSRHRYVTPELQELERAVLHAKQEREAREQQLFDAVQTEVRGYVNALRHTAYAIAYSDALLGLATVAYDEQYCAPTFSHEGALFITAGRHPVVEQVSSASFVVNDTRMNSCGERLWIITGPNMGGKSTYLRQVALMSILAQVGSFVPAEAAELPILDRIFTRIGAGDNLAQGKSTFLVEMEETATICRYATKQSLVILDEVGRGTSTQDGRALAHAIIEYLAHTTQCYTLFATHYHELTQLGNVEALSTESDVLSPTLIEDSEQVIHSIANYHMVCHRRGSELQFTHRLAPGAAESSFGIDVARLANVPDAIIARARTLLSHEYEGAEFAADASQNGAMMTSPSSQQMIQDDNLLQLRDRIKSVSYDDLSPRAALDFVWELKKQLEH